MCPHCRAFIKSSDRVCPYCDGPVGPRAVDLRNPAQYVGGFIPHAHFVTSMILLVNLGLFAASVIFSMRSGRGDFWGIDLQTLLLLGGKSREGIILGGQWWRLVTAGFLHGGILHFAMNSWVLFDLGAQVEEMYGSARLIVFYFVATVTGFFTSFWFSPAPSVGASAGLFGLIGAMIAFGMRERSRMGDMIRGLYVRWAVYGLLLGLLPIFRMDNYAHIGGLAGGFLTAYAAGAPKLVPTWGERFWRAAAGAALALTALAFLALYDWFSQVTQ